MIDKGTRHTLSDTMGWECLPLPCNHGIESEVPRPPRSSLPPKGERCEHPHCWGQAEYCVPKGTTPRTERSSLSLCVTCFAGYLDRLRDSITLAGEPCEFTLTLRAAENVFDGSHDYAADILRERCLHAACSEALQRRMEFQSLISQ